MTKNKSFVHRYYTAIIKLAFCLYFFGGAYYFIGEHLFLFFVLYTLIISVVFSLIMRLIEKKYEIAPADTQEESPQVRSALSFICGVIGIFFFLIAGALFIMGLGAALDHKRMFGLTFIFWIISIAPLLLGLFLFSKRKSL
ncbi:MAG: hypothetical protein H3C49_11875 [Alphaproteobacteria bacterium]|nr:hypothetical protein [Alphaproteobacteria bacterium]